MDTAEGGPILAVAALAREFSGLLRHATGVERLRAPVPIASRAAISGDHWILVAAGEGPNRAEAAARWAVETQSPRAVLSTGYCGGLDPGLNVGDIWTATEVRDASGASFPAVPPRSARKTNCGAVLSIDRVAVTAKEKAQLRSTGAGVVEMEAAAVGAVAREKGLPFHCIRVVSDSAASDLPVDFNRFRGPDGCIDARRAALSVIPRPWLWPRLVRLSVGASRASKLLGDYLADCRF